MVWQNLPKLSWCWNKISFTENTNELNKQSRAIEVNCAAIRFAFTFYTSIADDGILSFCIFYASHHIHSSACSLNHLLLIVRSAYSCLNKKNNKNQMEKKQVLHVFAPRLRLVPVVYLRLCCRCRSHSCAHTHTHTHRMPYGQSILPCWPMDNANLYCAALVLWMCNRRPESESPCIAMQMRNIKIAVYGAMQT